jgi:hypothetical protein
MPTRSRAKLAPLQLLTDQAVGEPGAVRGDGLGFETYATVLANASLGTPGPFTIGIFGEWGTGKTSLMRMIGEQLDRDEVVTVWFNAWQYEKEENPLIPLVGTIIQEIERKKAFTNTLKDAGKGLLRSLRAIAYGFSASAEVEVPGFAKLEAGFVAKDMIERETLLTPDPLIERSLYYHAFETLSKAPLPSGARVVVLIDDLDRCFPDKAIRLLESIKLVLAQRGFIFIIGVARSVIEGYLEHRYEKEYGLVGFEGGAYLDKIVQLAFPIPSHTGRMDVLAEEVISGVDESQREQVGSVIPLIAEHLGANPRSLVRFVNNVLIDVEISKRALKPAVPLEFFAITRCLQLRWRHFYDEVVLNRETAAFAAQTGNDEWLKKAEEVHSPFASTAKQLLSSQGLAKLVESEPCQRWLSDHDTRERAVLFLRTTLRSSEELGAAIDRGVVTVVAAAENQVGRALVRVLRRIERKFSEVHWTYQAGPSARNVVRTFERVMESIVRGNAVRNLIYVGRDDKGFILHDAVRAEGVDCNILVVPQEAGAKGWAETARSILEGLFGEARYRSEEPDGGNEVGARE